MPRLQRADDDDDDNYQCCTTVLSIIVESSRRSLYLNVSPTFSHQNKVFKYDSKCFNVVEEVGEREENDEPPLKMLKIHMTHYTHGFTEYKRLFVDILDQGSQTPAFFPDTT